MRASDEDGAEPVGGVVAAVCGADRRVALVNAFVESRSADTAVFN